MEVEVAVSWTSSGLNVRISILNSVTSLPNGVSSISVLNWVNTLLRKRKVVV